MSAEASDSNFKIVNVHLKVWLLGKVIKSHSLWIIFVGTCKWPHITCWSVLREIRALGSDRDFWSLEIVYGRNFGHHCLRIRATNIKCSWPHYKFTWTFQMSVQFLEARACQRHDLGEPVFGDGVLSMIVVPRQFTPCESFSSDCLKK